MKLNTTTALFIAPALFISLSASACPSTTSESLSETEMAIANYANLQSGAKNPDVYNFRTHKCESLSSARNDSQVSDHMPSDEEWLGFYSQFRQQGEDSSHALAHVFDYMMEDNENAGWRYSVAKQQYLEEPIPTHSAQIKAGS